MVDLDWLRDYADQWHNAWEVIGAIGSASAAAVAVWLATRERVDRKQAERDRDEAREAQRRAETSERRRDFEAQAHRVVATFVIPDDLARHDTDLVCHNYSDVPIMHVSFHFQGQKIDTAYRVTILPRDSASAPVPGPSGKPNAVEDYAVQFLDANGTYWRRGLDTSLRALARPAASSPL